MLAMYLPCLHHKHDVLQSPDVLQRISAHGHDVGTQARDQPASVAHPQKIGGIYSRRAKSIQRLHAALDQRGELSIQPKPRYFLSRTPQ